MNGFIILGNQLFNPSYLKSYQSVPIFMAEDFSLCTHFRYHKHKLVFFLSSMRHYAEQLKSEGFKVEYNVLSENSFFIQLEKFLKKNKISKIFTFEVEDHFFQVELEKFLKKMKIEWVQISSPMFLFSKIEFKDYLKKYKKPMMKNFYEQKRKELNILMTPNKKPLGGKFSFDQENRMKLPKKIDIPNLKFPKPDLMTQEVMKVVNKYFADHPGKTDDFWLPVSSKEADVWFQFFLKEKLDQFGPYEDALSPLDPFLFHSALSPLMNIGFLTPEAMIKKALKVQDKVSLASLEGFIRQIMGWREFIRGIYHEYDDLQQEKNFFNHQNKLSKKWYQGGTNIPVLDDVLEKVFKFGYNHHIERLMVIGNLMLLLEVHPQEVHRWFMEMYVDSSDWVMGPNIFGMSQFSDGGIFATKPYICGSNYWLKMSSYKKGDWTDGVDGLYWQFIEKNQSFFLKNPRMSTMVSLVKKMDKDKKDRIYKAANKLRSELTL
jgi:deoxyribodipyrimidine photolyase-related protein